MRFNPLRTYYSQKILFIGLIILLYFLPLCTGSFTNSLSQLGTRSERGPTVAQGTDTTIERTFGELNCSRLGYWNDNFGVPEKLEVHGSTLFGAFDTGFHIFNCSKPSGLEHLGQYIRQHPAFDFAIRGSIAYIAYTESGLQVLNISDLTKPEKIPFDSGTTKTATHVALDGDYLYVAWFEGGVSIYDITIPSTPFYIDSIASIYAGDIIVHDGFLFGENVTSASMLVYNVTNPLAPTLHFAYDLENYINDLFYSDDFLYVAVSYSFNGTGVKVFNISDVSTITSIGNFSTSIQEAKAIYVEASTIFISSAANGLLIYDIANISYPVLLSTLDCSDTPNDIWLKDSIAYIADSSQGIIAVSVSNTNSPVVLYKQSIGGSAVQVAVQENYAFVADSKDGLEIVDVSDTTEPTAVSSYAKDIAWGITDVVISGRYAFAATGFGGVLIFDISFPITPVLIGEIDHFADHLALQGSILYLSYNGLFATYDVSDVLAPELLGSYDSDSVTYDFVVTPTHAFIAAGFNGLLVLDIQDPSSIVFAHNPFSFGEHVHSVYFASGYLFVSYLSIGLQIYDVSDPLNFSLVSEYPFSQYIFDILVVQNFAFISYYYDGLHVLDISDIRNPSLVARYYQGGLFAGLAYSENVLFIANGLAGLELVTGPIFPFLETQKASLTMLSFLFVIISGLFLMFVTTRKRPSESSTSDYLRGYSQ